MAKFSVKGYCPCSEISMFPELFPEKMSKHAKETLEVLGNRAKYMIYPKGEINYGCSNITLVLLTTNKLAMHVVRDLERMIANVPIRDEGKKILIHDVLSPSVIPDITVAPQSPYKFVLANPESEFHIFQDKNFLVAIRNTEQYTEMYIYRKVRI